MQIAGVIFYGLISGLSEFLPISASAHQYIFSYLSGYVPGHPFVLLMVYLGGFAAILVCSWSRLNHIRRELRLASLPKNRRKRVPDMQAVWDFRLVMMGLVPIIAGLVFQQQAEVFFGKLTWLCLTLILSGILLFLPQLLPVGNQDSRALSPFHGVLMGFLCAFSMIPGISRIALVSYFCRTRRCSRESGFDLALLYSIPVLFGVAVVQLIVLLSGSWDFTGMISLYGIIAGLTAFGGGVAGISLMRYFAVKLDFYGFSYYCWGLSVFCFIYYLMT